MDSSIESAEATAIRECRLHFLRAAVEHREVRLGETLFRKVFEPSRKYWAELGLPVPNVSGADWTPQQWAASRLFAEGEAQMIWGWAAGHHLDYEWVHRAALDEIRRSSFPKRLFAVIPGYQPPEFVWRAWFFEHESERQYRDSIESDFKDKVGEYVSAIKLQRRKFLTERESQNAHYCWSVARVCLGRSWSEIAKKDTRGLTWQAVAKAVGPILVRIGLEPHNQKPSRKRPSTLSKQ